MYKENNEIYQFCLIFNGFTVKIGRFYQMYRDIYTRFT
jgi:hypothetical protein